MAQIQDMLHPSAPPGQLVPGGQWMQPKGDMPPVYVTDPAHIKRILSEEGYITHDPRGPQPNTGSDPVPNATEMALRAELDQMKAEMEALRASAKEQIALELASLRAKMQTDFKSVETAATGRKR